MYFGFLNVLKPPGMTSHDLVAFLRKLLRERKIGHSGTLDPNAAGVLVIALGPATKLLEYLESGVKEYFGLMRLGVETDTYDADGTIVAIQRDKQISWELIEGQTSHFVGQIEQKPPLISAVQVRGKRLYQYAMEGEEVEVPTRIVRIDQICLDPLYQQPLYGYNDLIRLRVTCGKGTYIRSLVHDFGRAIGLGAHLAALLRTRSDQFGIDESLTLTELQHFVETGRLSEKVVPPEKALPFPEYCLDSQEATRVGNGNYIPISAQVSPGTRYSLLHKNQLLAIGEVRKLPSGYALQPLKVLSHGLLD